MLRLLAHALVAALLTTLANAQAYTPASERPPAIAREFRGAWIASIYNIDWPSSKNLSPASQQAELRSLLDHLAALRINAVIFQVRPHCDALYPSPTEPWSPWLTGTMGKSPGYDPLAFCIREAHARGIEVHAWFNPFRALANTSHPTSANHITRTHPHLTKRYGSAIWCDPALPESRSRALNTILDVTRRYDIDGVHLDDYFYPYPVASQRFNDGKSPAQRRAFVDDFVKSLYSSVKKQKNYVRVGISPFGIWRPGTPPTIEASIDSYDHLACDARKWLKNGWVDYLAPQLYWRISPAKQSFPTLLTWWRQQGQRPVWPGIATSRIQSSEDPGRPASEITNQITLSRQIPSTSHGHLHWSAKALARNQGGIATRLASTYTQPAAIPPMPWISKRSPNAPGVSASAKGNQTTISWIPDPSTSKIAIQTRNGNTWRTAHIGPASTRSLSLPRADAIAITAFDRLGNASPTKTLTL